MAQDENQQQEGEQKPKQDNRQQKQNNKKPAAKKPQTKLTLVAIIAKIDADSTFSAQYLEELTQWFGSMKPAEQILISQFLLQETDLTKLSIFLRRLLRADSTFQEKTQEIKQLVPISQREYQTFYLIVRSLDHTDQCLAWMEDTTTETKKDFIRSVSWLGDTSKQILNDVIKPEANNAQVTTALQTLEVI